MAPYPSNRTIATILCVLPLFAGPIWACQSPQTIASPPATLAQAAPPRTVVDYFLETPERYFLTSFQITD